MHQFEPTDRSQHLAHLLAELYRLESLVQAGNSEDIVRQVMDMDWRCVTDQFESIVARYCYGIGHYARRIIHNLLRPYLLRHDCVRLQTHLERLEAAIEDSPSLHADADAEVATAWQSERERAGRRQRHVRAMPPIVSLDGLREAATLKIALGLALAGRHPQFDAGERVPVDEAAWENFRRAASDMRPEDTLAGRLVSSLEEQATDRNPPRGGQQAAPDDAG